MKRETAEFVADQMEIHSDFVINKIMTLNFFDSRIAIVRDVPPGFLRLLPEEEVIDGLVPVISRTDLLDAIIS